VQPVDTSSFAARLEAGLLDLALVTPEMAPDTLRARRLFDETYVCILRQGHPAEAALDLDRFCALDCQSASKTDPLSASKIDPPMRRRDQGLSRRN
jgi:DNA-binding transcriptional LysR family regulator